MARKIALLRRGSVAEIESVFLPRARQSGLDCEADVN